MPIEEVKAKSKKGNDMKKLMCAVAAVAAGVAFAEDAAPAVNSTEIVGYNTITLRPGKRMCSTSFLQVKDESGLTLADLIPVGYLDVTEWADNSKKGFKGQLTVKVLNNGGGIETDGANKDKCYQFYAPWTKSNGWGATYWTQVDATGTTKIEDASTVKFPIGTGLWIEMSADSYFDGKYPDNQYKVEFDGIENL